MNSWQEKNAMRTVSLEPAGRAVRKRPTGDDSAAGAGGQCRTNEGPAVDARAHGDAHCPLGAPSTRTFTE
jgi:hypothetical protein